jgi:hypothetical protein
VQSANDGRTQRAACSPITGSLEAGKDDKHRLKPRAIEDTTGRGTLAVRDFHYLAPQEFRAAKPPRSAEQWSALQTDR